jgi:hypothetical protein
MIFIRAYPRETQEMVFDAHDRAFAFFKGACQRGIYDNMKTAGGNDLRRQGLPLQSPLFEADFVDRYQLDKSHRFIIDVVLWFICSTDQAVRRNTHASHCSSASCPDNHT